MNLRQKIGAALFLSSGAIIGAGIIAGIGVSLVQAVPLAISGNMFAAFFVTGVTLLAAFVGGLALVGDIH